MYNYKLKINLTKKERGKILTHIFSFNKILSRQQVGNSIFSQQYFYRRSSSQKRRDHLYSDFRPLQIIALTRFCLNQSQTPSLKFSQSRTMKLDTHWSMTGIIKRFSRFLAQLHVDFWRKWHPGCIIFMSHDIFFSEELRNPRSDHPAMFIRSTRRS